MIDFHGTLVKKIVHIITILYSSITAPKAEDNNSIFQESIKNDHPKDWMVILHNVNELIECANQSFCKKKQFFIKKISVKCSDAESKQIEIMRFYTSWNPQGFSKTRARTLVTQIKIINSDGSVEEYLDMPN